MNIDKGAIRLAATLGPFADSIANEGAGTFNTFDDREPVIIGEAE